MINDDSCRILYSLSLSQGVFCNMVFIGCAAHCRVFIGCADPDYFPVSVLPVGLMLRQVHWKL